MPNFRLGRKKLRFADAVHVWLRSSGPVCLRSHKSPELSLCPRLLFLNKRRRLFGKVLLEGEHVFVFWLILRVVPPRQRGKMGWSFSEVLLITVRTQADGYGLPNADNTSTPLPVRPLLLLPR